MSLNNTIYLCDFNGGVVQNAYKYVYDGFKLIAVYNNNDLVMTFTWQPESLGMDVPVSMTYSGTTYYYVTDGNKNVTALLDASGNRVAEYVYGPFGQTVSATGSMAQINPFRFSSEFHDDETGLVYYNYRYYSSELGRWTKRDPIEEEGGSNLYGFATNNAIIVVDHKGLEDEASLIYMYYMQNMGISEPGAAIYFPQERREKYMSPNNGLFRFDNAIKNNLKTLKKYKCTFIIAADNDDYYHNGNNYCCNDRSC